MEKFILKNQEMINDFVSGCTFMGTGGGGSYEVGVQLLEEQLKKGNEIGWINHSYLSENDYTCSPFLMGSLEGPTKEARNEMKEIYGLGDVKYNETQRMCISIQQLEKICNQRVKALVPIELGGANTAACVCTASELGIECLDGDYTGRAIPEIQQTTPYINKQNLLPITSCDAWGNIATINSTVNWRMAERMGKQLAVAGYSYCSQAGFMADSVNTLTSLVKGTLSRCYEIGKRLREAVEEGLDPADTISEYVNGWVLCKGTITCKTVEPKTDYYWAIHEITGEGDYVGKNLKIWLKNENHICWQDDKVIVSSPDMIQIIDSITGKPYTNDILKEGMQVSVIAMKAEPIFRSERGLQALSPRAFGFDIDYSEVENNIDK